MHLGPLAPMDESSSASKIEGSPVSQETAPEILNRLKKKMTAVLRAHRGLAPLVKTQVETAAVHSSACTVCNAVNVLPATEKETQVESFVAALLKAITDVQTARIPSLKAAIALREAEDLFVAAAGALSAELTALNSAHGELKQDEAVIAATHLANIASKYTRVSTWNGSETAAEELELTDGDRAVLLAVRKAAVAAAFAVAKAKARETAFSDGIDAVKAKEMPKSVKQPVRPTEEEVQRYLTSMEAALKDRQVAHRNCAALLTMRDNLFAENRSAFENLGKARAQAEASPLAKRSLEYRALIALAASIQNSSGEASSLLSFYDSDNYCDPKRLDAAHNPVVSAAEVEQLETLRKMLREYAYVLARRNEAQSGISDIEHNTGPHVSRHGITESRNWDEVTAWLDGYEEMCAAAAEENLIRATKMDLLVQSVQKHGEELKEGEQALFRRLMRFKPDSRKPCDELRVVMNFAMWLSNSCKTEEGEYPLY